MILLAELAFKSDRLLDEKSGAPLDNNWNDISSMGTFSSERTGFVTQKPTQLLQRCIKLVNSNLILDFLRDKALGLNPITLTIAC